MILCPCPKCQATLKAPESAAGKTLACPKCKARLTVPSPEPMPAKAVHDALPAERPAPSERLSARPKQPRDDLEVAESSAPSQRRAKRQGFPLWILAVIIPAGLLLCCGAVIIGFIAYRGSAHTSSDNGKDAAGSSSDGAVVASFTEHNVFDLYKAYTANEASADLKYTGKRVEVATRYWPDDNKPIRGNDGNYQFGICWLDARAVVWICFRALETEKLARLPDYLIGGKLTVRGVCKFDGRRVVIDDAVLLLLSPQEIEEEKARRQNAEDEADRAVIRRGEEALRKEEEWKRIGFRGVSDFERQQNREAIVEAGKVRARRSNEGKPPIK